MRNLSRIIVLSLLCFAGVADAYVGPGAGVTFLSALVGFIVALFTGLFVILLWLFRKPLSKLRKKKTTQMQGDQVKNQQKSEKTESCEEDIKRKKL